MKLVLNAHKVAEVISRNQASAQEYKIHSKSENTALKTLLKSVDKVRYP